jgi:hypothetical protein
MERLNAQALEALVKDHGVKLAAFPRFLRVVTLEDGETVHNAFFDRNFREEER